MLFYHQKVWWLRPPPAMNSIQPLHPVCRDVSGPRLPHRRLLDPKGSGGNGGLYDAAVGLPIQADSEEFARPNNKGV